MQIKPSRLCFKTQNAAVMFKIAMLIVENSDATDPFFGAERITKEAAGQKFTLVSSLYDVEQTTSHQEVNGVE